jgi:hypothetical protein
LLAYAIEARAEARKETRASDRLRAAEGTQIHDQIIVGDFREHADKIADGSVSLILCDPPYGARDLPGLLTDLANFAEKKLELEGRLLCYIGQSKLPVALDALRTKLSYWWTSASFHRATNIVHGFDISSSWKPVLMFTKGARTRSRLICDVMREPKEKQFHDWQQNQSEAEYWISKLCPPDGTVVDPFLGSATTAVAAQKLNRPWIGFEIDEATARIASARLADPGRAAAD